MQPGSPASLAHRRDVRLAREPPRLELTRQLRDDVEPPGRSRRFERLREGMLDSIASAPRLPQGRRIPCRDVVSRIGFQRMIRDVSTFSDHAL